MLYLGPHNFPSSPFPLSVTQAPARRACANIYNLFEDLCAQSTPSSPPLATATATLASLPAYQLFTELSNSFADPDLAFQRGAFKPITASEIDLPPPRPPPDPGNSLLWIHRLPAQLRSHFQSDTGFFEQPLIKYASIGRTERALPQPRLYGTPTEYHALLDKAEAAGMLHWSVVSQETPTYARLAATIEMSLFAVSKSPQKSRLISWPRVQNDCMPQPPHVSLPYPSMFEAIQVHGSMPGAFFMDISNMFHNITLPRWLSRLFPMKPVPFAHLSPATRRRIAKRTKLPRHKAELLLRPCQATMPMGFKWAVYVAHTFVESCFQQSFRAIAARLPSLPAMHLRRFRAEEAPFIVTSQEPLLLHIIDDVAVVTLNWPPSRIKMWHQIGRSVPETNLLPIANKKSSKPGAVIRDSITFIGCVWDFSKRLILPAPDKLQAITAHAKSLLHAHSANAKDWERVAGKLVWFAMLNRPLLSPTCSIFSTRQAIDPLSQQTISPGRKRELRTLTALLPLARVDLKLDVSTIIVAFDASLSAGAVTYTTAPPQVVQNLWAAAQEARHAQTVEPHRQMAVVTDLVSTHTWKHAFTHHWNKSEHINGLEASTAVLSVEWLTRKRVTDSRVILLTDSLVKLGALQKGRSSKPGLLICRRFAALTLAHKLRVSLLYVSSAMNPADKYTRL